MNFWAERQILRGRKCPRAEQGDTCRALNVNEMSQQDLAVLCDSWDSQAPLSTRIFWAGVSLPWHRRGRRAEQAEQLHGPVGVIWQHRSLFPSKRRNSCSTAASRQQLQLDGVAWYFLCPSRDPCAAGVVALCVIKCNDEHKVSFPVQAARVQG